VKLSQAQESLKLIYLNDFALGLDIFDQRGEKVRLGWQL